MDTIRFSSILKQKGTRVVIELPVDPHATWGEKQRHDVTGSINGHTYRGPLVVENERFFLTLGPAWRRDTGLAAGAGVEVILTAEGPQVDHLSVDIAAALQASPPARSFFESLPTFYRKNYIRWIESAKHPATKAKRIQEMVSLLQDKKREK